MLTPLSLTAELREALSKAMAHPSEWCAEERLLTVHPSTVTFADVVPDFVVERAGQYDDGDLLVEGYWPDVPVRLQIEGGELTGRIKIACGGNLPLDPHPEIVALLP